MPELHIIAGANGAGKSTIGAGYLPLQIRQKCDIFDGDKLFMGKQRELWQAGITAIKEARKLAFAFVTESFDGLVEDALEKKADFVYEGHFTNEATWNIPRQFKAAGFSVHMIYFGLRDTHLSEFRVANRAKAGGHYVDPATVANNFYGNLQQLNKHYEMFDTLRIIDTSESEHKMLAAFKNGRIASSLAFSDLPEWFVVYLPNLTEKIKLSL